LKNIIDLPGIERKKQPRFISPMLATLTENYFSKKDWLYERKLDGERCIIYKNDDDIILYSRNQKNINNSYPEIVELIKNQKEPNFIIDGEIVTFDKGITSFSKLQKRIHLKDPKKALQTKIKVYFYAFDLLYLGNYSMVKVPLRLRKIVLKQFLNFKDSLRYTNHKNTYGVEFLNEACNKGWEGLIAKKANSKYIPKRSTDWLKFKCVNEQEFVIGGFTLPKGKRIGFGALLLGYYENSALRYAGQVGTGFNTKLLKSLKKQFSKIKQSKNPFSSRDITPKYVQWLKPTLVCQVGFTEWTKSGKLRHPRFLGLRRDKRAKKVIREI